MAKLPGEPATGKRTIVRTQVTPAGPGNHCNKTTSLFNTTACLTLPLKLSSFLLLVAEKENTTTNNNILS